MLNIVILELNTKQQLLIVTIYGSFRCLHSTQSIVIVSVLWAEYVQSRLVVLCSLRILVHYVHVLRICASRTTDYRA
jgi:hypothetical protein